MCEQCRELKKASQESIRELANGEGELYEALARAAELAIDDEELRQDMLDNAVAEGIAHRAAEVASYCTAAQFHHVRPFLILGSWASSMMQMELDEERAQYMRNRLGMSEN